MTAAPPRARLVALGASNLTRGLQALLAAARARAGGPVELHAALGYGRSYCQTSRFLFRSLPGIGACGMWDALARAPRHPATTGLVMDVGNDLLYGVPVEDLLASVDGALVRLRAHCDEVVVVGLPMPSVREVGRARYAFVCTVLVPGCRVSLCEARERAEATEVGLAELARRHGARHVAVPRGWFGLDAIHVRTRRWPAVCDALFGCAPERRAFLDLGAMRAWLRVRRARPAVRTVFGAERQSAQPSLRFDDGSTGSLW